MANVIPTSSLGRNHTLQYMYSATQGNSVDVAAESDEATVRDLDGREREKQEESIVNSCSPKEESAVKTRGHSVDSPRTMKTSPESSPPPSLEDPDRPAAKPGINEM